MKFVSTLSPNCWLAFVQLSVVSGHKFMYRPWGACACSTESALVCATFSSLRYLLHRLFTSAQLLNIYPAVEAAAYCESPFSLLQEEVCTLQHFTFHTCHWKRDRKEYITDWVVGYTLEFPPLLERLKGVTTTALELFLALNIWMHFLCRNSPLPV